MKSHNLIDRKKNSACFNIAWCGGALPPAGIRSRREALAVSSIVHNGKWAAGAVGVPVWLSGCAAGFESRTRFHALSDA